MQHFDLVSSSFVQPSLAQVQHQAEIYAQLASQAQALTFACTAPQLSCCMLEKAQMQFLFEQYHFVLPRYMQAAIAKRQQEFVLGRLLAQMLLLQQRGQQIGQQLIITSATEKLPIWPQGMYGSISHHPSHVVVTLCSQAQYLGIDIEQILPKADADNIQHCVLTPSENQLWKNKLQQQLAWNEYVSLIFSFKESLYKAIYPQVLQYIDFLQAELIALDVQQQRAYFRFDSALQQQFQLCAIYQGQWQRVDESVVTLIYA